LELELAEEREATVPLDDGRGSPDPGGSQDASPTRSRAVNKGVEDAKRAFEVLKQQVDVKEALRLRTASEAEHFFARLEAEKLELEVLKDRIERPRARRRSHSGTPRSRAEGAEAAAAGARRISRRREGEGEGVGLESKPADDVDSEGLEGGEEEEGGEKDVALDLADMDDDEDLESDVFRNARLGGGREGAGGRDRDRERELADAAVLDRLKTEVRRLEAEVGHNKALVEEERRAVEHRKRSYRAEMEELRGELETLCDINDRLDNELTLKSRGCFRRRIPSGSPVSEGTPRTPQPMLRRNENSGGSGASSSTTARRSRRRQEEELAQHYQRQAVRRQYPEVDFAMDEPW